MRKVAVIALVLLLGEVSTLRADFVRLYNLEFDQSSSFINDPATNYQINFVVSEIFTNASIIDYSIADVNILANGVGTGANGFTGGAFTQVSAGGGNLLVDLNFNGSGPSVTTGGVLSFVLPGNFGDLRSFTNGQPAPYEYDTDGSGTPEFTGELSAIPEPCSSLAILGVAGMVVLRRRRRSKS